MNNPFEKLYKEDVIEHSTKENPKEDKFIYIDVFSEEEEENNMLSDEEMFKMKREEKKKEEREKKQNLKLEPLIPVGIMNRKNNTKKAIKLDDGCILQNGKKFSSGF